MPNPRAKGAKRRRVNATDLDLAAKVANAGESGFGLEVTPSDDENDIANVNTSDNQSGLYGSHRRSVPSRGTDRSSRRFTSSRSLRSASEAPSMSQRSVASTSTKNPYSASKHRIRRVMDRGSSVSVRSTCTSHRRTMFPQAAVHIVCAIGENLARETCVASLDAGTPISLQVTKQSNGQTYAETLAYLEALRPDEVLLNEGRKNSPLAKKILQLYAVDDVSTPATSSVNPTGEKSGDTPKTNTIVKFISRSCFDQTKGAELLRRLARPETYDATLLEEYILLSSSHAVLHYTQQTLGASFSRRSLDITVNSGGKNRMAIDRSTLLQLEILTNAKTGKTKNSLVSDIDLTKTTVGTRLLRSSLIAPPCRSDTINARLDLVDTFLSNEDFFYAVLEHLQSLPAIDKMLTNIAVVPRLKTAKTKCTRESPVVTARFASKGISALVYIKSTLSALPALARILKDHLAELDGVHGPQEDETAFTGRSSLLIGLGGGPASTDRLKRHCLLRAIVQALSQPQLAAIQELVSSVFTESTSFSRNANAMRHQECFALKSNDNGMMEILRKAFLANVDDIYKKADEYAEMHGFHVSVRYSTSRGYYLSVPVEIAADLPDCFIQPNKCGNHIYCTTEEVHSLNIRAQDNVQDLLLMTYERIQEVLEHARSKYDALASLSDAIALLDLCHGFADKVTLSKVPWSRPVVVDSTSSTPDSMGIIIRNGRYAIDVSESFLSTSDGPATIIPNDTFASGAKPFTVISGINGSGKSTYLKQIAIIVLLAHCGSYVPAEQASIPLRTRLCVRMGTADDQENNISSFMLEMKETAFICSNADRNSLILLDELGRATSNEDGISLAWAVSEFLLSKGAMTFFVSHYPQLCHLDQFYSTVQNQHLNASISTELQGGIHYTHKLAPGPCTISHNYGVEMAESCGWPSSIIDEARKIESKIKNKVSSNRIYSHTATVNNESVNSQMAAMKTLASKLVDAVQNEHTITSLRRRLQELRAKVVDGPSPTKRHQAPDSSSCLHATKTTGIDEQDHDSHCGEPGTNMDRNIIDIQSKGVDMTQHNSLGGRIDDDNSSLTSYDTTGGSSTQT